MILVSSVLLNPVLNNSSNLQIVFLNMHKMRIPMNANISKHNKVRAATDLFQIINNTVVVGNVHAGLAGGHQIRHAGDVGKLARRLLLTEAVPPGQRLLTDGLDLQLCKFVSLHDLRCFRSRYVTPSTTYLKNS